ncbi:hypothetical protein [Prosthecobacter sp.]|uniref:hypothetical protein n=1 Tax=Prosthecobacter sp. TaxID=1965333 RepID=UPI003783D6F6
MRLLRLHTLCVSALLALPSSSFSHQLDEYLQSTLVVIDPATIRLQLILTPGVSIADHVITYLDPNADGIISPAESSTYATLLKRDLHAQLDALRLDLTLTASTIPSPEELRTGAGLIQLEFTASPGSLAAGPHTLVLQNRHLPATSVYLVNASKPRTPEIQVTQQARSLNQSISTIAFTYHPPTNPSPSLTLIASFSALLITASAFFWRFLSPRKSEQA